jgi:ATP-dependent helicase HrpA
LQWRAEFLKHNAALRAQVESLEAKIRRRDVLVDEQTMCEFYLGRLPEQIHSIAALEKWLKASQLTTTLFMQRSDLMHREVIEATEAAFPDVLDVSGNELVVTYKFEPSQSDDGATLTVPEPLLNSLNAEQLAWAIPGWHVEKVTAILRALPKEQRKHFVPVPDAAARCLLQINSSADMTSALATWISRESAQPINAEQLLLLQLPEYLRVNLRVTRLDGRVVTQGRELVALRRTLRGTSPPAVQAANQPVVHRAWDFGDLPEQRIVERGGVRFSVFPAIHAQDDGITLRECGSLVEATVLSHRGALRLAILALPQQSKFVHKQFTDQRELVLLSQGVSGSRPLADLFVERVFQECFFPVEQPLARTKLQFEALLDAGRARIGDVAQRLLVRAGETLKLLRTVRQQLSALPIANFKDAVGDVQEQLGVLTPPDFIASIPEPWFGHLPRYLRAVSRRLERLPGNAKRDAEVMKLIAPFVIAIKQFSGKALSHPELDKLHWMLEEYRVSLFAQDLKTSMPVSDKRLAEQVQRAKEESLR